MGLTRAVKDTVRARIERDPGFRKTLLEEGIERLLAGELELGKAVLRDYVKATIGFQELGGLTAKSPKSLMRMLGPQGSGCWGRKAIRRHDTCSRSSAAFKSTRAYT